MNCTYHKCPPDSYFSIWGKRWMFIVDFKTTPSSFGFYRDCLKRGKLFIFWRFSLSIDSPT